MFNLLVILDLGAEAAADEVSRSAESLARDGIALPGVSSSHAGTTLPNALYGGHVMWRLTFPDEQRYWECLASPAWQARIAPLLAQRDGARVDTIAYRPIRSHVAPPRGEAGIWRCLVLAVDAGTPRDTIAAFERDMLLMPDHVSTIGSWSLGRTLHADGRRRWTHVWEQEFEDMAGLEGEYMLNPIHWGFIDGWYDPESPKRIVDIVCIVHAAFERDGAVIA